jgi:hypothetical protein
VFEFLVSLFDFGGGVISYFTSCGERGGLLLAGYGVI